MLTITPLQIDAIRFSALLGPFVRDSVTPSVLSAKPSAEVSDSEWLILEDACHDVLINHGPIVEEAKAKQSKGVYTVSISGVEGAYVVFAPEYDRVGVFSTLGSAKSYVNDEHGEFIVDDE